ncbi:MAG: hypothetical protein IT580_09435 [Verrucomicrobiales bacterium]|nr:hypothetical protein [Verrucomicrobiales bacterium]
MENLTYRQRLALKLDGHPLLRTLVLDPAFSAAFLGLVLCGLGVAVGIPKVWRTTPEGFAKATIRVSLIDFVQAWSLARNARIQALAGKDELAFQTWRAALINNLGSPTLHRGLLEFLRSTPQAPPDHAMSGLLSASWLLALGGTNASDLTLSADVLEKFRLPLVALEWLDTLTEASPELDAARARCLLSAGQADAFDRAWSQHATAWASDPHMQLYRDAWVAGWDSGSASLEAMLRLKTALQQPGTQGLTAARLLLRSAARQGVAEDLELALARLQQGQADAVSEHVLYWRYLVSMGRFEDARRQAKALPTSPRLAFDAAEYAAALASLGLREEALAYLGNAIPRFQAHPGVWEVYLAILGDSRKWNEIRSAAAQVRGQTATFETARILGSFAEYRADVAENRRVSADEHARQLASARILDNRLALRIASELVRDGRAGPAVKLLQGKRGEMSDLPSYWFALFSAAMGARDLPILVESSAELVTRLPRDPIALSNRAAVLLAVERKPSEALEITLQLITSHPDSEPFRINHAFALLLNGRTDEAATLLERINPSRLETQAASAYFLALAEIHWARQNWRAADDVLPRIQPGYLLPPQVDRLEELRRGVRQHLDR